MGFEDRQYYREESTPFYAGSSFGRHSMVTILIVINVVIFFLDAFTPKEEGGHWLSNALALDTNHPWYLWTYLTYGFAHSPIDEDIWHILGNMLALFFLGRPVEARLGRKEFLRFYLISIVASGLGWMVVRLILGQPAMVIGASGGVTATVMLFVFMYPRQTIYLMGILPMPAWLLGVLLVGSDILRAFRAGGGGNVAWEAHLIGAAFGALYFKMRWNFEKFQFGDFSKVFKSRPKLRVHNPDAGDNKLKEQADQILAKINEHGEESLTSKERRILNKYSQKLRKNRDR